MSNKLRDMSIKSKIFIVSTVIIILGFILLYLGIYLFIPQAYKIYKENTLQNKVSEFVNELSNNTYSDVQEDIDKFAFENGLIINITDSDEETIYSSAREGFSEPKKLDLPHPDKNFNKEKRKFTNFYMEENFYFKNIDKDCNISVKAIISAKYDTQNLLQVFFPIAVGGIIIIAVTVAYFYSRIISKPLIEINNKAKKMSNLDFSERFSPKGNDEIAQLSNSLNIMCDNLYHNINMLEKANDALRKDIDREREIQKERKEFIATISHELKSPITIIAGQLEGMIYNIGKYSDRDKYLKETYNVTRDMEKLVLEILELSKRDNDNFDLSIENINISKIIKDVLRENYYFIEEKKLRLVEEISEDVYIYADRKLIKKAFVNIVRNAIQHSPVGEQVLVYLTKDEFIVKNTGVHIEEKELNNLFKAFYRVDKSRNSKTGGTGLGLYIVKSILDKHKNIQYSIKSDYNSVSFMLKIME